jgi:hypothetical protein
MKKTIIPILLVLELTVGLALRLYKIDNPIADWHEFRQADTASVSRLYLRNGIDLLKPRYQDISNIQSGRDNPNGYRFVEFPLYNALHAEIAKVTNFTIEKSGRLLSVFLSMIALAGLWVLARGLWDEITSLWVVAFAATNAYFVYYSRVILPEPLMIALALWSVIFLMNFAQNQKIRWAILGFGFFAMAVLIKPFIACWFIGPVLYAWVKRGFQQTALVSVGLAIGCVPLVLWRMWMLRFPEGIPVSLWLFNSDGIRFRPAFFRWLFYERLVKLILGGWGIAALVVGLAKNFKRSDLLPLGMLTGTLVYLFVVATGNVRHDYYQILLFPPLALFVGRGLSELVCGRWISRVSGLILSIVIFFGSIAFGWYEVKGYYQINHPEIIEAGLIADKLLPPEAKVIAPFFGDTAFLYYTNRPGWPLGYDVDKKISQGAAAYVSVNFDDETNLLMKKYKVLEKTDKFVLIDLTKPQK